MNVLFSVCYFTLASNLIHRFDFEFVGTLHTIRFYDFVIRPLCNLILSKLRVLYLYHPVVHGHWSGLVLIFLFYTYFND